MSLLTRRSMAALPGLSLAGCRAQPGASRGQPAAWTPEWDQQLIERAVRAADERFDPNQQMLRVIVGPGYKYHTRLRDTVAHPTRDSLEYALALLESGSPERGERAVRILGRVLPLQNADPSSKWYGLWGYYLEEPPEKMEPADWNWADFNGSLLLLIEFRHGARLGEPLRQSVREAIGRAAASIRRRNVRMGYTNIAIKGAFVTMAAAELAGDPDLKQYARQRTASLAAHIDETGSFEEYNSPTYARVSLTSLVRFRMYVKDQETRARMGRIERRLWEHLAAHWDAGRAQFAGPMSRCYSSDLGAPLWLEKALGGRLGIASVSGSPAADAETAIHDYRCPEDLAASFLSPRPAREHVELFGFEQAGDARLPVQGTTWFDSAFSLGSVNRGDFWNQRRPLIAYFGDRSRPARLAVMRVVKDGYDFSSALLFSVQRGPRVLGLVNFRNPGGDRHISLDPIKDGAFLCGRLFLELRLEGLPDGYRLEERAHGVTVGSTLISLAFQICGAAFGQYSPQFKSTPADRNLIVTLDFKPAAPSRVVWHDVKTAWAAFALELGRPGDAVPVPQALAERRGPAVELRWEDLWLRGGAEVVQAPRQQQLFEARIGGQPIAVRRLSDAPLV